MPKRLGKKLKTQTEMTSPRDIVEEGKCGKDRMTDVELGLNCLHLSPRCVQFKPFIMEESPGDSSIMRHNFKTINKRMDRVTLTDVGNAKQDHCVVVEKAKTHPNGDTIIIYGRKINEEGSGVGEVFQLATKDLKDAWEDEEMIAENVEIGSVVKYVQVGDDFLFQGNTKRPRWVSRRFLHYISLRCGIPSCLKTYNPKIEFVKRSKSSHREVLTISLSRIDHRGNFLKKTASFFGSRDLNNPEHYTLQYLWSTFCGLFAQILLFLLMLSL